MVALNDSARLGEPFAPILQGCPRYFRTGDFSFGHIVMNIMSFPSVHMSKVRFAKLLLACAPPPLPADNVTVTAPFNVVSIYHADPLHTSDCNRRTFYIVFFHLRGCQSSEFRIDALVIYG